MPSKRSYAGNAEARGEGSILTVSLKENYALEDLGLNLGGLSGLEEEGLRIFYKRGKPKVNGSSFVDYLKSHGWINVKQAAERAGVSPPTVIKRSEEHPHGFVRFLSKGHYFYLVDSGILNLFTFNKLYYYSGPPPKGIRLIKIEEEVPLDSLSSLGIDAADLMRTGRLEPGKEGHVKNRSLVAYLETEGGWMTPKDAAKKFGIPRTTVNFRVKHSPEVRIAIRSGNGWRILINANKEALFERNGPLNPVSGHAQTQEKMLDENAEGTGLIEELRKHLELMEPELAGLIREHKIAYNGVYTRKELREMGIYDFMKGRGFHPDSSKNALAAYTGRSIVDFFSSYYRLPGRTGGKIEPVEEQTKQPAEGIEKSPEPALAYLPRVKPDEIEQLKKELSEGRQLSGKDKGRVFSDFLLYGNELKCGEFDQAAENEIIGRREELGAMLIVDICNRGGLKKRGRKPKEPVMGFELPEEGLEQIPDEEDLNYLIGIRS